ncbi:MAG: putative ABC exporter domain-containing protein [Candidatus Hydrogenedentota bacterium]
MLHPGLVTLIRLRMKGVVRQFLRSLRRPRHIALSLLGVGLIGLYLISLVVSGMGILEEGGSQFPFMAEYRDMLATPAILAPLLLIFALLGILLTLLVPTAPLAFQPNEIDWLFPAPVPRWQVILYRLWGVLLQSVVISFLIAMGMHAVSANIVLTFHGLLFYWLCANLAAITIAQWHRGLGNGLRKWGTLVALAGGTASYAAYIGFAVTGGHATAGSVLEALAADPLIQGAALPLRPFAILIFAQAPWPILAAHGLVCLALVPVLAVALCRVHETSIERIVAESERHYQRLERFRRGQVFQGPSGSAGSLRLPHFPHWSGFGPLYRRQVMAGLRQSRKLLLVFLALALAGGAGALYSGGRGMGALGAFAIFGAVYGAWFLPFDFRADRSRMEWLRAFPVKAVTLAWAQVAANATLAGGPPAALMFVGVLAGTGLSPAPFVAALLLLSFTLCISAVENLLFLLFPQHSMFNMRGNLHAMGQAYALFFIRGVFYAALLFLTTLPGGLARLLFEWPLFLSGLMAAFSMLLAASGFICLTAWAFERYDISREIDA